MHFKSTHLQAIALEVARAIVNILVADHMKPGGV